MLEGKEPGLQRPTALGRLGTARTQDELVPSNCASVPQGKLSRSIGRTGGGAPGHAPTNASLLGLHGCFSWTLLRGFVTTFLNTAGPS